MTAIGLANGFAPSLAAGLAIGSVVYGVGPTDARTYLGVFGLLTVASLLACCLPARRAIRIHSLDTGHLVPIRAIIRAAKEVL